MDVQWSAEAGAGLVIPVLMSTARWRSASCGPTSRASKDRNRKYEMPAGARMAIDVPPATRPHLGTRR